ncbi:MAG: hypothetical protein BWY81_00829 [Firmicutes bacterium ADurb.Bin467]|nr:MAG: hypothetical protein BWY81_00829 [Firmicutes bacterium ADurb.Bin467]
MNRHEIGSWAESAACQHLKANGWTIVDRNVRLGCGEIDIVARRQDVTAFVEVKSRSSDRFGTPAEAVTNAKKRRILDAAIRYAQQHGILDEKLRFDIVELADGKIRHIEGAFDASGGSF